MAITILKDPGAQLAAFADNTYFLQSNVAGVRTIDAEIQFTGDPLKTLTALAFDGKARINIRGTLSSVMTKYNSPIQNGLTPDQFIQLPNEEMRKDVNIRFNDGTGPTSFIEARTYKAVDTQFLLKWAGTAPDAWLINDGKTRIALAGQLIPVSVYTAGPAYNVRVNNVVKGSLLAAPGTDFFMQGVWKEQSTADFNRIGEVPYYIDYITDRTCYPRAKTLYFLNEFGGWEWFNFIDFEESEQAEKQQYSVYSGMDYASEIHQHVEQSATKLRLYGRTDTAENLGYLRYLVSSPVVVDETGARVRLLETEIDLDKQGLIEPRVTIQYLEKKVINF
jgi:hypothetical protein